MSAITVLTPPSRIWPNQVGRVIERDGEVLSQVWEPGRGWIDGSTIAEVDWAPPASAALLADLGVRITGDEPTNEEEEP